MKPLEANVEIGDFRIIRRIGAGGMGVVYQARQISLDRMVALKVLGASLTHPGDILRFKREAQAAARLKHPGIAAIYYTGQDDQACYMALEYIDGLTLRSVILRLATAANKDFDIKSLLQENTKVECPVSPLRFDEPTEEATPTVQGPAAEPFAMHELTPEAERLIATKQYIRWACEMIRDAALALEHAHCQSVIHRDIKPQNIMLDRDGGVHVIDFGIARYFEDMSLTQTGQLVGTPMYMSPEQVAGRLNVDSRSDVYSLGLVMYELLTLRRPVVAPTRDALLRGVMTKAMIPVSWKNSAVPRSVESVVHKAIAKDPEDRYQHSADFAEDLQRCLDRKPVLAEPYHYKFDEREIAAERPWTVLVTALCLFFAGVSYLFSQAPVAIAGAKNVPAIAREQNAWALLYVVLGIASICSGYGLLRARPWSRWVGIPAAVLITGLSAKDLFGVIWRRVLFAPTGAGVEYLLDTMIGDAQYFTVVGILILCGLFSLFVLLLERRPKYWFQRSQQIRQEHEHLMTSIRTSHGPRSDAR